MTARYGTSFPQHSPAAPGKGMGFTGVDDPYEPPLKPELTIHCSTKPTQDLVLEVVRYLESHGLLSA